MAIEQKKPDKPKRCKSMQNSGDNNCHRFAEHIRNIFEDGLRISNKDSHFILSTMPVAHLSDIGKLIQDPDNADYHALMELIYFPDETIQINLENRIESARFQPQDMVSILSHIMAVESDTRILSPKKQRLLTMPTPRTGAHTFLQRLNLCRHLEPELIQTIEAAVNPFIAGRYKVWIRNMTREPGKRDTQFLKNLFLKLVPQYQQRDPLIGFALRFLEETPIDTDPLQGLIQSKQRCLQHIQRLDQLDAKRKNHNFETRIALGIREPHDDKHVLMQKVVFLDEIGLALYKRNI